ncbi:MULTISPECIES: hypothetical protein [Chitinophagaceae]
MTKTEKYRIQASEPWAESLNDEQLKSLIKSTDFSKKQEEEGKDFCYFLYKRQYTSNDREVDYAFMAYTLNEPSNLEAASVSDIVLSENMTYLIHRIAVCRDGVLIDKTPDISVKVLDDENDSGGGMLNNTQKINITIKDLRLYDVLILEDSKEKIYSEKDFLLKDYMRYLWLSPDTYWAYGVYDFKVINKRNEPIVFRKNFFRDDSRNLMPAVIETLPSGETFSLHYDNYLNPTDASREIFPFIDFVTESSWQQLSSHIYLYYEAAYNQQKLSEFAPELAQELDAIVEQDEKMRYAIEYVQNHVYYLFNAYEMHGHKPQDPAITYSNKQGDCKAKTTLLKVVLDYIGVESSVVLVNYKTDFYFKYYLPSLLAFNHVIVKINYKGETYFVDATSRDDLGLLENRDFLSFCHYLEIKPDTDLQKCTPHKYPKFAIEETVDFHTKGSSGDLKLTTKYRYNRANNMRRYFKRTSKREIIDSWNKSLFYCLNYQNDRDENDFRKVFKDAQIHIVSDDKDLNELVVEYSATVDNPYYTNKQGKQFLMYFDRNLIKGAILDYIVADGTFWFNYDSEKYVVNLYTDQRIDTTEKYTVQECNIDNKYFTYTSKKEIAKNGGTVRIKFNPISNQEIPTEDYETFRKAYQKVPDSNYGLGIDLIPAGFGDRLKFGLKKMFGS